MELTPLEKAARTFADAQTKEKAARVHLETCQLLLEKSQTDLLDASKARYKAEQLLMMAACAGENAAD